MPDPIQMHAAIDVTAIVESVLTHSRIAREHWAPIVDSAKQFEILSGRVRVVKITEGLTRIMVMNPYRFLQQIQSADFHFPPNDPRFEEELKLAQFTGTTVEVQFFRGLSEAQNTITSVEVADYFPLVG